MTDWQQVEIDELFHEFDIEISCLVTENHRITMRGIDQSEDEMIEELKKLAPQDHEFIRPEITLVQNFHNDLRRAANHLALLSLVTRLEHWTRKFVKSLSLTTDKNRPAIARDMEVLNARLGIAPFPVDFFVELVTARDSVIHADSQAQWEFRGPRRVADRYVEFGELKFTSEHLSEAVEKSKKQVKWYDEQITALRSS